jgi:hypothetical protein
MVSAVRSFCCLIFTIPLKNSKDVLGQRDGFEQQKGQSISRVIVDFGPNRVQ